MTISHTSARSMFLDPCRFQDDASEISANVQKYQTVV